MVEKLKLNYIAPSTRKNKKYMAIFNDGFVVHFGDSRYLNFTDHRDKERKKQYILRHSNEKHLWYDAPLMPASLSRWILWNEPNINDAIQNYKNRFNL
jgi:hypothetical protein